MWSAVHCALVYGVARGAMALGLPLGQPALVTIVLVAALPSASNVSMLAERFGADNDRIARIIFWTTVVALAVFIPLENLPKRLRLRSGKQAAK